jgi:hypothetical protein
MLILENGFDLEAPDVNDNTPLLNALYYMPEFQLVEVARTLIAAGADVAAVNKHGEGCLHMLLRRLSACNHYLMASETADSLVDILAVLLERGCSPILANTEGYTPLDAAMSPTAWTLLCRALEKVGGSMKKEILDLDDREGIVQTEAELEERFAEVTTHKTRTPPRPTEYSRLYTDQPCYLCGGHSYMELRQPPFNEFISRVVEELCFGIHMVLCWHEHGEECLLIQEEDSCHFVDYCPNKMSRDVKRKRSWRRHVAYRMWHEGILRTPSDCQRWAADEEIGL